MSGNGTGAADTYIVVWENNEYKIYWYYDGSYIGLPMYDANGYAYSYSVDEGTISGSDTYGTFTYVSEKTEVSDLVNNFVNRRENVTASTPTKTVTSVTDSSSQAQTAADSSGNIYVAVDDTVTYTITYYNNTNNYADVVVTDTLDEGVDFVSATLPDGTSVSYAEAITKTASITYDTTTRVVTWTIENVSAFTEESVTLTVTVNKDAKTLDAGTGETSADIDNTAQVSIGGVTPVSTSNVTNPLEDDDPEKPAKSVDISSSAGNYEDAGEYVTVGDTLYYRISYYNHYNALAIITITDVLDEGLTYVLGGTSYDDSTRTVTWSFDASAFESGYVYLEVTVNSAARITANVT